MPLAVLPSDSSGASSRVGSSFVPQRRVPPLSCCTSSGCAGQRDRNLRRAVGSLSLFSGYWRVQVSARRMLLRALCHLVFTDARVIRNTASSSHVPYFFPTLSYIWAESHLFSCCWACKRAYTGKTKNKIQQTKPPTRIHSL